MMLSMRTTFRIDDDLLTELKARARQERVPLTRLVNRVLRTGLDSGQVRGKAYREFAASMGEARIDLDKALVLAAGLDDEEVLRKLSLRK